MIVLDLESLAVLDRLDLPGAHGAGMALQGDVFYTTNLSGGGFDALFAIDTATNQVIGEGTDSPHPIPHNIAVTPDRSKLYVTHSGGSANQVSVYALAADGTPTYIKSVTVGFNPFGISFVP